MNTDETGTPSTELIDAELEALLDTNLEDIEDLPEFADYVPTGFYKLTIVDSGLDSVEMDADKKDSSKGQIVVPVAKIVFRIDEALELKDENEAALIKPLMQFSKSYFIKGDAEKKAKVIAIIKMQFKEIAATLPAGTTMRDMLSMIKGMACTGNIASKRNKKDADQYFINFSNLKPL